MENERRRERKGGSRKERERRTEKRRKNGRNNLRESEYRRVGKEVVSWGKKGER